MKTFALLMAAGLATAFGQETPKTLWAHVDFVDIAAGKGAEYHKAQTESLIPWHQEVVKSGQELAYLNYTRLFPHGSSAGAEEVRIHLHRKLSTAVRSPIRNSRPVPPGISETSKGELWRMRHSVNLDKFLQAQAVRVLLIRQKSGSSINEVVDIYKNGHSGIEAAKNMGLVVFERQFSQGGANGYTLAVLWGYSDMDQVEALYQPASGPTPPDRALDLEKLRHVRDVVRMELWQKRPEFVLAQ